MALRIEWAAPGMLAPRQYTGRAVKYTISQPVLPSEKRMQEAECYKRARISRSITKSVDLRPSPQLALDFRSDFKNWPNWAIANMKSAILATDRWYEIETCHGKGQIKMLATSRGLLYHARKPASILDSPRADRTERGRLHISRDVLSARCVG